MKRRRACLLLLLLLGVEGALSLSRAEKRIYKYKVMEMFRHAYDSYMTHAYPADELMPISCKGRVRGREPGRGDVDDALGHFSLTLVDTLDSLAILGEVDEFNGAVKRVLNQVTFNTDVVVSVFETNIRILGGLLGAHFAAVALKEKGVAQLQWYTDELAWKADEIAQRLLPAFNSSTGLPYARVNLRHGLPTPSKGGWDTTCTACAGTLLLEFAALSRLTGNPVYEEKAHHAMEVLWSKRNASHDLVGTVINVNTGEWVRKDSGVGAGIDSYYEYCLKSYILLGEETYLKRFEKHYGGIMRYIASGPFLLDCDMHRPHNKKPVMDSLLAFWPGLQVLWGDIEPAASTHDLLYYVAQKHNFLPEAFNIDMKNLVWANHPLRPEFAESTYFLYKATGDPYYLDIGKSIIGSLEGYARVPCGFAAVKDVRTKHHEDRMDSFVLAETFKYLFLLFAEDDDLILPLDDFVFTTEAHLLPLSLGRMERQSTSKLGSRGKARERRSEQLHVHSPGGPAQPPHHAQLQCKASRQGKANLLLYDRIFRRQCSSPRYRPTAGSQTKGPTVTPKFTHKAVAARYFPNGIDFHNSVHLHLLSRLGINIDNRDTKAIVVTYHPYTAHSPQMAEEGAILLQGIAEMQAQENKSSRARRLVQIIQPAMEGIGQGFEAGPALFGPDMTSSVSVKGAVVRAEPFQACEPLETTSAEVKGHVVMVQRGGCSFMKKVQNAQDAGAKAVLVINNAQGDVATQSTFSMAPDGMEDYIHIHSAFLSTQDGELLLNLHNTVSSGDLPEVVVQIGRWPEETAAGGSSEEKVEEESSLQEKDEDSGVSSVSNQSSVDELPHKEHEP